VADYLPPRVEAAAERARLRAAQTFVGLHAAEKLLARGGLDAVAIASPPYFHPAQTRLAVNAGLHVFLATPVAIDVPGCHSVRESDVIARGRKRVLFVDSQPRASEAYREAVRRMHAGAIGEFCYGEVSAQAGRPALRAQPGKPEARLQNWAFEPTLSGDTLVHRHTAAIDVMSWVMKDAPPLRCTGAGGRRLNADPGDASDHCAILYEYANDVGVAFTARQRDTFGEPGGMAHRMFAERGVFAAQAGGRVTLRGTGEGVYRSGGTADLVENGSVANIRAFHDLVRRGEVSNATVAPAVHGTLVAIMGRMAVKQKSTVTWADVMASKQILHPDLAGLHA